MDFIAGGVFKGVPLTVANLKSLQAYLHFPVAQKPNGHGKNGATIKTDWAIGLIDHFYKDSSESEKQRMLNAIMGKKQRHLDRSKATRHNRDILRAFKGLDPQDQQFFAELFADEQRLFNERERFEEEEAKARKMREVEVKYAGRQHVTPGVLTTLLPAASPGCRASVTRHPPLKRYQAFYSDPVSSHLTMIPLIIIVGPKF